MIKQILITIGFVLGVLLSSYLLSAMVEWNLNISELSNWGRLLILVFSAGIFGTFTKFGNNLKG